MTPKLLRSIASSLAIAMLLFSVTADAGRRKRRKRRKQDTSILQAKKAFKKGLGNYKLGKFQEALQSFEKAYELKPLPAFLFNLGQCHRQLGNYKKAIFFFEGYLREDPDSANAETVEELLALARQKSEEQRAQIKADDERKAQERALALKRAEQENLSLEQKKAEEKRKTIEAEAVRKSAEAATIRAEADVRAKAMAAQQHTGPAGPFYTTWWFWTAVASTVALAAGGTAIALTTGGETIYVPPGGSVGFLDRR